MSTALRAQGLDEASILTLREGSISTVSLEHLLFGEGERDSAANVEARLGLVDTTTARPQYVAERDAALTVLHQLPRLQRVVAEKLAAYGRPLGAQLAARTVAQELRLSEDEVLRLHRQALKRMREAMDAKGLGPELPARTERKLRRRRAAAPGGAGRPDGACAPCGGVPPPVGVGRVGAHHHREEGGHVHGGRVRRSRILKGEYVKYSATTGTRHLVCASAEQGRCPNLRAGHCLCGAQVAPREGSLVLKESRRGGRFVKRWLVRCLRCA
ncbi:hypothetical protein EJ065_5686 [Corallococcus coralloides]|uniref:Uncharacterized protein n=1 Tax=Corallococcus coralloides TaxID=184914 RepID=A0A410RZ36_CORCK|nr:hypothetical protein [Corallococcus coralloides]QAT87219.1 hypothetical protein EJ065_5686 [Corallococcus coralloides]